MKDKQVKNQKTIDLHNIYYDVLVLSENLVDLAQSGDWEQLVSYEIEYLYAVENLTQLSHELEIQQAITSKFVSLLNQIIENERITKTYLQQHLDFLSKEMKQLDQKRELNNSYGQFNEPALPMIIKAIE
ncbi:flagellar protein FliT [Providencia burhodogranariea]|uniref:Flagellar protein FliT n=1 Tax=Providencia burhodogranariea DSM 19968 TaxID=1141662 RepID=K8WNL2_9GAMM|nr:flagellar protein FliT [Providencia burhodogranariea]EKT62203.1 export chaperone protein for FliD [Providencia burhodogranariea DSM 19968]